LGRLHRTVVAAFVSAASIAGPCTNALAFDLSVDDSQPAVPTPGQRYLATALEELGALGIQAAWYWGHMKHTSPDDVSFSWQTWR